MRLSVFAFLVVACIKVVSADIDEVDEAQVRRLMSQVTHIVRKRYNVTSRFMQPTPQAKRTVLVVDDQRLTLRQATRILENMQRETFGEAQPRRRIDPKESSRWSLPINYAFDSTLTSTEKEIIRAGIERWRSATCLEFKEHADRSLLGPGLWFMKGSGCYSYVGRVSDTKPQNVSLGSGCDSPGVTSHEIGHALGLWHEHMRPDRDDHISINWMNMISGFEGAFSKVSVEDDLDYGTGYDVTSIMHYDSLGFSIDYWGKRQVIKPKNIHQLTAIGQREFLSFNDAKRLNFHYDCIAMMCNGENLPKKCQNGGYQDPRNCAKCRCPAGFGGDFCGNVVSSAQCGGHVTVPKCSSTSVTSPNWPDAYSADTSCSWMIHSEGGLIFAFEKQPEMKANLADSCYDFVEIITDMSKPSSPGHKFCLGGKSSGRIASTDNGKAMVYFRSTSAPNGGSQPGFKLHIYATCEGTTTYTLTKECLVTPTGYDYEGNQTSSDGGACQDWTGQSNLRALSFPDKNLQNAGSNCRNPDSRADPWCYVSSDYSKVEYCRNIPQCPTEMNSATTAPPPPTTTTMATTTTTHAKACKNMIWKQCGGFGYKGETCCPDRSACQQISKWYSQCRPTRILDRLPFAKECLESKEGRMYLGRVAVTRSGIPCQRWVSNSPHHNKYKQDSLFPDKTARDAENYCRNPEGSFHEGVWCFTTNSKVRWEVCDVPLCSVKREFYQTPWSWKPQNNDI